LLTEGAEIQLPSELLRRKISRLEAYWRLRLHLWRGISTFHRPIDQSLTNLQSFENSKPKNAKAFLKISPKQMKVSPTSHCPHQTPIKFNQLRMQSTGENQ